ncbi:MAG: polysaccharide biosynthesis protein [Bacilli bacterium]|nr:polysaccharide biosynthesis protein [Bacilli bacterium]
MFENKKILITGGTGSWGKCLTKYLLSCNTKEIIIYSRNEFLQVMMKREYNDERIKFIIGDVRDFERLNESMSNVDYVFHLSALKHVPICEEHPYETVKTNIIGTENVINAAINNKVKKVIGVSSDKAVSPYNLYGMTKAVEEKLLINANKKSDITKFVCIRAGNVMGSNGSVIPLFISQLKEKNEVTLTNSEMTRFFITLDEAIGLLTKAADISVGGEILVMSMPSLRIKDLITVLAKHYGKKDSKINEIGIRPGEKIHEELVSLVESYNTYRLDENYYLIVPEIMKDELSKFYNDFKNFEKLGNKSYNSSTNLLNHEGIEERLRNGNFI